MTSTTKIVLLDNEAFVNRLLILTAGIAHKILNLQDPEQDDIARLKAKAIEFINNPTSFDERLAISVLALLDLLPEDILMPDMISDGELEAALADTFDGMAGVTTTLGDILWKNQNSQASV